MGMTLEEQETIIQFSRTEDVAHVWTTDTRMINKFDRLCAGEDSAWKHINESTQQGTDEIVAKEYEVDKKMISFRLKSAPKREYTEEELEALRERMKKMQEARAAKQADSPVPG